MYSKSLCVAPTIEQWLCDPGSVAYFVGGVQEIYFKFLSLSFEVCSRVLQIKLAKSEKLTLETIGWYPHGSSSKLFSPQPPSPSLWIIYGRILGNVHAVRDFSSQLKWQSFWSAPISYFRSCGTQEYRWCKRKLERMSWPTPVISRPVSKINSLD